VRTPAPLESHVFASQLLATRIIQNYSLIPQVEGGEMERNADAAGTIKRHENKNMRLCGTDPLVFLVPPPEKG
jgi:hypothetical protein